MSMIMVATALNAADLATIRGGGLCVKENWVSQQLQRALRDDIIRLEARGSFKPSGLTSRLARVGAPETELFDESDRRVCVIDDRGDGDGGGDVGGDRDARLEIGEELERVCKQLRAGLGREELALGEYYYSFSGAGTSLPLHLDEHHPATKHTPPSDESHRRSISFLIYLSDASTLAGGALRAYPRTNACGCGAHSGNLQIGWLESEEDGSSLPVFLDAWIHPAWMDERCPERSAAVQWAAVRATEESLEAAEDRFYEACQPRSQLYTVLADGSLVTPLTAQPIAHNDPDFAGASYEPDAFVEQLRARLREPYRRGFSGLIMQEHARQPVVDVEAIDGTLVLFDSVCVPHLVLPVRAGQRLAIGGWFHEKSQNYAAWYDSAFAVCAHLAEGNNELF